MRNLRYANSFAKVIIADIVYLQGDDFYQYESEKDLFEENNPDEVFDPIEYLLQWYDGDDDHYMQSKYNAYDLNTPFLGNLIKINGYKGYFLFSKSHFGIGLSRLISIY